MKRPRRPPIVECRRCLRLLSWASCRSRVTRVMSAVTPATRAGKTGGKQMSRRTRTALVAALATLTLAIGMAPAQAATSNCPSGYFCIWGDYSYKTSGLDTALVKFYNYIPNYGYWQYAGTSIGASNTATSLYNHSSGGNDARIYKGTNGTGDGYTIGPLSSRSNLATSIAPTGFNDTIESAYFCTSDPTC